MEAFLFYLLKVSGILLLFFGVYNVFLKKETLFSGNRYFLLGGMAAAIALPFIYINRYVYLVGPTLAVEKPAHQPLIQGVADTGVDWAAILFILYATGVFLLFSRFIVQLMSLASLIRQNVVRSGQGYIYVECSEPIAPFSFFNYIIYNPSEYKPHELSAILEHERAHCSQWHSLDILFAHLVTILLWINPLAWLYRKNIQQNLEFLADALATKNMESLKNYQHMLLKVSGIPLYNPITNNFYNSLIKKRIVMLQKSKSHQRNSWKFAMVLPLILGFMVVFNTRVIAQQSEHSIHETRDDTKMSVHKDMSDSDLNALKKEVKDKVGGTFSYSGLKRNSAREISRIKIEYRDKNGSAANATYDESEGIPTIYFGSHENGGIYISGNENWEHGQTDGSNVFILEEKGMHDGSKTIRIKKKGDKKENQMVWVDSDDGEHLKVEITEADGKKTIRVNGKEVSESEWEAMEKEDESHKKVIRIRNRESGENRNVMIIRDQVDEHVDPIEVLSDKGHGYFFIDTDGDENTLYSIDGKESTREEVSALDPDTIEKIEVTKGEKTVRRFGKKAKDGVVEITTKKQ